MRHRAGLGAGGVSGVRGLPAGGGDAVGAGGRVPAADAGGGRGDAGDVGDGEAGVGGVYKVFDIKCLS